MEELALNMYGLGEDGQGILDFDNIAVDLLIEEADLDITGTWTFITHPIGLLHDQIGNLEWSNADHVIDTDVSFGDNNITNVADIGLDSISADDGIGPILANHNLEISKVDPELKLTDSGGSNYARLVLSDTDNKLNLHNIVSRPAGTANAIDLDGSDDEIDCGNDSSLNITSSFTIAGWIFSNTNDVSFRGIITKWDDSPGKQYWFGHQNSKLVLNLSSNGSNDNISTGTDTFSTGGWVHVAVIFDDTANTVKFFLDGTLDSGGAITETATISSEAATKLFLGFNEAAANARFHGRMDEFAIWDTALADSDIADAATGIELDPLNSFPTSGTPISTNLQGRWSFNHTAMNQAPGGTDVEDSSSNSNHGTADASMTDGDFVAGYVASATTDTEISLIQSQDGEGGDEAGISTFGGTSSRHVIEGKTIRFNIAEMEVAQIDAAGLLTIDNGNPTAQQLILRAAVGVSENIFEAQDSSDNILLAIGQDGDLNMYGNAIYGDVTSEGDLTLFSTAHGTKGRIIFNNPTTGMVYNGDDEAASIGGGSNSHTINGSVEKSLWEFHTDGNTAPGGTVYHRHSNTPGLSADATWLKSAGDHDTQTIVSDGEQLGHLRFGGHDGSGAVTYALAAEIGVFVDGTPGAADMPGRMLFSVSPDGGQVPVEALRISQDKTSRFSGKVSFTQTDDNEYIDSLSDGYLDYSVTTAHRFNMSTADTDVRMEFVGTSNSGLFEWMEDEDYFQFADDIFVGSEEIFGNKFKITSIGGYAIKLTNETGANTVAGQLVKADTANDDSVVLTAPGDTECFGVFFDSGVADGSEAWVVVAGIADVAHDDNVAAVRGNWMGTGVGAGYAATSLSPAAAPTHFEEIGHCIESVAAGGAGTHILARCVLHFN
jgi:hypothetical protein